MYNDIFKLNERTVQFCAGKCKSICYGCAKVHSIKFKEYLQYVRYSLKDVC